MGTNRVCSELTIMGRRVLRYYVEHRDPVPLRKADVAARFRVSRQSINHHVRWLCEGGMLEPIPGTHGMYRPTVLGRASLGQIKRKSATGRARMACYCPSCNQRIPVE